MLQLDDLKAVFFDLDNVLVFSEIVHFKAWQIVMEQIGVNPMMLDFQSLIGISDSTQAVILQEQFSTKEDAATIWQMKRKAFFELIPQGFAAPEGRETFLQTVSCYTTAVVSSSGKEVIRNVLEGEKILSRFNFIIGHEDCLRHKPDPLPYLLALEKAQVKPEQALVIEDSSSGIIAAKRANIPVIGIYKDQSPDQIVDNVTYFKSFSEANAWLLSHNLVKTNVI